MDVRDVTVEVRDVTLRRRGQILPEHLDVRATVRDLEPGEWDLRLPTEHPMAAVLREEGAGVICTHRDPDVGVLWSGPAEPTEKAGSDDPLGTLEVKGVTDDVILWNRTAYPDPARASTAQTKGWDVRSGTVEGIMREYVAANLGPAATADRQVPGLVLAESLGRGGTARRSVRFDVLGELLRDLATSGGLTYSLGQEGGVLVYRVREPRNLTGTVRLDVRNGTLASSTSARTRATLTHAIVAGQGTGAARTLVERVNPGAADPWGPWGRVERFLDQRNTNNLGELAQAGDKALLEGAPTATVAAVASDDLTMDWPRKWREGDLVAVVIGGAESTARVTSVTMHLSRDGVKVGAGIGPVQPYGVVARLERRQRELEARLSALERNTGTDTVA